DVFPLETADVVDTRMDTHSARTLCRPIPSKTSGLRVQPGTGCCIALLRTIPCTNDANAMIVRPHVLIVRIHDVSIRPKGYRVGITHESTPIRRDSELAGHARPCIDRSRGRHANKREMKN